MLLSDSRPARAQREADYGDAFFHNGNMFDFLDQAEKTVAMVLESGASRSSPAATT